MSVDITIIKRDGRREQLDITKIQKMTDTKIAEIDELLAKKEKEIMTV